MIVALGLLLALALDLTVNASAAGAQALAGSYPLTSYQWQLCETKVQLPKNGEASPCTDAMVNVAYQDGRITQPSTGRGTNPRPRAPRATI